jgi:hypothetical protein
MAISWGSGLCFSARGKEAAILRKLLLVIVLIAASFAGGAFVNGPGLAWAKKYITAYAGSSLITPENSHANQDADQPPKAQDDPFAELALVPKTSEEPASSLPPGSASTPLNVLTTNNGSEQTAASAGSTPEEHQTPSTSRERGKVSEGGTVADSTARLQEVPQVLAKPAMPPRAITLPSEIDPMSRSGTQTSRGLDPSSSAAGTNWDDASDSAPPKAVIAGHTPPASRPKLEMPQDGANAPLAKDQATSPAKLQADIPAKVHNAVKITNPTRADRGWNDLRKRMKQMGITRYWIEAEPTSVAHFHCVIPLAGTRAVSQQFEAEGEDEFQAADAALRRVALWRATEQ